MSIMLKNSFWEYREALKQRMNPQSTQAAAEGDGEYHAKAALPPVNEKLIQTIWAQQLIGPTGLRTADGTPVRVLDPGRWNDTAGPDFKDATVMLGFETLKGDVEIHLKASDWLGHAHQRDLDYNTVILHAVLTIDDAKTCDMRHNGTSLPRLEMEPFIFPDLETLRRSITPDDYPYTRNESVGQCQALMASLEAPTMADFLDRAGDERLTSKMRRLADQAESADLEQVFFQAMMMALGTGPGKTLYYLLAKRAPLADLFDYVRDLPPERRVTGLEALLIHVAGLAPESGALAEAPAESRARVEELGRLWQAFEPYWSDRVIPPTRRWYQSIRPVNFPVRRLAGVAILLERAMRKGKMPLEDLISHVRAGRASLEGATPTRRRKHPLLAQLVDWFSVSGEGHFWGGHYSFMAKPSARRMNLIGEGTATSLVLNAALPAMLLAARKTDDDSLAEAVHRLYGLVPPLQPNHITEFMTHRLFGEGNQAADLINTERRRQALFQIFYSCCKGEDRDCKACYYRQ